MPGAASLARPRCPFSILGLRTIRSRSLAPVSCGAAQSEQMLISIPAILGVTLGRLIAREFFMKLVCCFLAAALTPMVTMASADRAAAQASYEQRDRS